MKTGFSSTLDSLMHISGSSSSDQGIARTAAEELSIFVETQHKTIENFVQLRSAVTFSSAREIEDALVAMRHITSALKELVDFHRAGILGSSFEIPFHRANEALKKAEKQASALLAHVGR